MCENSRRGVQGQRAQAVGGLHGRGSTGDSYRRVLGRTRHAASGLSNHSAERGTIRNLDHIIVSPNTSRQKPASCNRLQGTSHALGLLTCISGLLCSSAPIVLPVEKRVRRPPAPRDHSSRLTPSPCLCSNVATSTTLFKPPALLELTSRPLCDPLM